MLKSLRAVAAIGAALTLLMSKPVQAQDVGINVTGAAAGTPLAILDISGNTLATQRGLLIPRMTYAQRIQMSTNVPPYAPGVLTVADAGMWVYQTDDTTQPHGFYYWDGATLSWIRMSFGPGWSRTGNALTNVATNFLGTIANTTPAAAGTDIVIGTNSVERMRILTTNGYVGVGTAVPAEILDVNGGMRVYTTVAPGNLLGTTGVIRYTTASPAGTTNNYHDGYQAAPASPVNWLRLENAEKRLNYQPYDSTAYTTCGAGHTYITSGATPLDFGGAGVPYSDPTNTPWPSAGTTDRWRVQYLFQSTELQANPPTGFGMCPGTILDFAIKMVDDDQLSPQCFYDIYWRFTEVPAATTGLTTFVPTASTNGFYHGAYQAYTAGSGWQIFTNGATYAGVPPSQVLQAPFVWGGVNDIVLEISATRGFNPGWSPRPEMQYTLGYSATRYAYGAGPLPANGFLITDATFPATTGLTADRPIIRFNGQVKQPTPVTGHSDYINYDGAVLIGRPTWATGASPVMKGPGVIAAQYGVYDNLIKLSDHVFDSYFDGSVRPEDAEAAAGYTRVELDRLKDFLAEERRLPNMPSREEWTESGKPSLGQMGTRLWQTVEDQALYIAELERELSSLEYKVLNTADAEATIAEIRASTLLTPEEKDRLIAILESKAAPANR